jgi:hypothetical protein
MNCLQKEENGGLSGRRKKDDSNPNHPSLAQKANVTCHRPAILPGNGGDDGARTRDLCRDRAAL